jgi:hypothetical protein
VRFAVNANLDHLARGAGRIVYVEQVTKEPDDTDSGH